MDGFPRSIAIAGAWGYIGRKLLDSALEMGLEAHALDPGPVPGDLDVERVALHGDEEAFYRLDVDLFHLALHPEHRKKGLGILLERAIEEPLLILNEKPMAEPEHPEACGALIAALKGSRAVLLFDFLELFDPMTQAIAEFLRGFDRVEIDSVYLQRSKDREDPERPRNYKKMVHIQYQESVHCMAFLLNLLGSLKGSPAAVFDEGLSVRAQSQPYDPPNPEAYPYVVDGRCSYELKIGNTEVKGLTDFKAGAEFTKRKVVKGRGDGRAFVIETNHFEGEKYLRIDGVDQGFAADASSYQYIISTLGEWYRERDRQELMSGVYPNPEFARLTYQLSSALWRSCREGKRIELPSARALLDFDAGFAGAAAQFPRYASSS